MENSGIATGFLPHSSAKAVYATIGAVETFVQLHYSAQIDRLGTCGLTNPVHLVRCRDDEIEHRNQARERAEPLGLFLMPGVGWSALGLRSGRVARRV